MKIRSLLIFGVSFGLTFLAAYLLINYRSYLAAKILTPLTSVASKTPPETSSKPPVDLAEIHLRLKIAKLNLDTQVEPVGLTQTNNLDTPQDAANLGWYKFGPVPGGAGNALINGDYDTATGNSGIFADLDKLQTGDEIEVTTDTGKLKFVVTQISSLPFDQFPSDQLLQTKSGKNLILVTTSGVWDTQTQTRGERIVVEAVLKSETTT
ncbi:MAG: Peptidase C60 sortase A and B [Candidatus Gottesmanbacteria bacterium GW2011_GWB1_43_11]|uniref:Peptidase C60 sortase A and B n=1 Tax=Candidatus Gottesmanbacteria bacterium GW2011_GWB1_43_11 TaxID=1618446 RepID=A0A0G1CH40_9BACT|nr:MAG: Peptidase C60 sortase A and B [Candidatus Gottesmanbacteria bacterium GW2011_GWA2_42_16]KKS54370.1 MAG: Peptidase C60 sortase A and B [Candidatus Gottesmanbacteria bacterium GW2011_GWA1_42_26]KKS80237.1 MAG: Peptidase C60 sortase A and B [Candidatus Gottesmanbacteria bacterium GW2011_GWC1_43_10]KKS84789.1 MAG: Peptidase C60 sortase A and B [Candidatus Gottesmanbacteria bacterium GW2011_GWB1_43_11]OGG10575.1 MAG: hypothetical protein A2699_03555 [Candidatus Gottesmanbacteria bacterium RI